MTKYNVTIKQWCVTDFSFYPKFDDYLWANHQGKMLRIVLNHYERTNKCYSNKKLFSST